jgi:predicted dienelactone hydrolase
MNLRAYSLLGLVALCSLLCAPPQVQAEQTVQALRRDGKTTPLMVYERSSQECLPLALISHGAGGSEKGYVYLAQGLEALGWRVLVMGHAESGRTSMRTHIRQSGFQTGLAHLAQDAAALEWRQFDIEAALRWAQGVCPTSKPARRILVGHSMGATTVNLEAGARNLVGVKGQDRFDAYIALSPQGVGSVFPENAWRDIRKPFLQITGTLDKALEGGPQTREQAFHNMPKGCHWLVVIDGAGHMSFAGRGTGSLRDEQLTLGLIRDFLDASRSLECTAPTTISPNVRLLTK